jgi:1-deoxy-D-xylulose-5-phosphate reductoisomerase
MGPKISVDSSTLMNKGLEVIEASRLFDMPADSIDILIHPQGIIHSMVEFRDNTVIAQMGAPDMRGPLQYALTYPERRESLAAAVDFPDIGRLTFEEPDYASFPCLSLAYEALRTGGTMTAACNAANEEAVALFLKKSIGFNDIPILIERAMLAHAAADDMDIENIYAADIEARCNVKEYACAI